MEIPVYLFLGFLDSGKTSFIQGALEDANFNEGERTLLLICEEGEEEYAPERFVFPNVYPERVEGESALDAANLRSLQKKHRAEQVMVEYNGMWSLRTFITAMPDEWVIAQQTALFEAETFASFNVNMRNLVYEKLQNSDCVFFNRVPSGFDIMPLHKAVRAANRNAEIAYEYEDGRVEGDTIEDPLPFDVNAPVIEIADDDYALWYRDVMTTPEKYSGKTVKFKGQLATGPDMPRDTLVIGRMVMTCCVEDIRYGGVVCADVPAKKWRTRDWAVLTAKVRLERNRLYGGDGPVLHTLSLNPTTPPEQEVVTF